MNFKFYAPKLECVSLMNRLTEDQRTFIAQSIEESYQKKSTTLAVWIDIEKEFDTVWREGLPLKLLKIGRAGKMYDWMADSLLDRTAREQLNSEVGKEIRLKQGVPQG